MENVNLALLAKTSQEMSQANNGLLQEILPKKYLSSTNFLSATPKLSDSWLWKGILKTSQRLNLKKQMLPNRQRIVNKHLDRIMNPNQILSSQNRSKKMNEVHLMLKVSNIITNNPQSQNLEKMLTLFEQDSIDQIQKIPLSQHGQRNDSMIRIPNQNGKFSIKTAYHLATHEQDSSPPQNFLISNLKKLQRLKIHDRHKMLLWKLIQDMLPTRARLSNIIPNIQLERCLLCNEEEEMSIHLFVQCSIVHIIWQQSSWPLYLALLPTNSMTDWIQMIIDHVPLLSLIALKNHHFQLFAVIVMEFILRLRNYIMHNHSNLLLKKIMIQVETTYQVYKQAWKQKAQLP